MKSAPELIALLDEASDYVIARAYFGLPIQQCPRIEALIEALAELPEATVQPSAAVLMARRQEKKRTDLRVIAGTAFDDGYAQCDRESYVNEVMR